MPLEILRIQDRIKLTAKEVETIVADHIRKTTGRMATGVEIHVARNEFGAATVYLAFQDEQP